MTWIVFENHGEIDPRLITTMGVNVKENDSAIGYFGTGLKYAIAVAAREGAEVVIASGETEYVFAAQPETIRGKTFQFITMNGQPLGFTTELGKNWAPWMAYREFYCNAMDEGGEVRVATERPEPFTGRTVIAIRGGSMLRAHQNRHEWLISGAPFAANSWAEAHHGAGLGLFYRGILVSKLNYPSVFKYNLVREQGLTEDRTLASAFYAQQQIAHFWAEGNAPVESLRQVILPPETSYEAKMDWDWSSIAPTEQFCEEVLSAYRRNSARMNDSLINLIRKHRRDAKEFAPAEVELTRVEQTMLDRALAALVRFGQPVEFPIVVVESLGSQALVGLARDGKIYLTKATFGKGTKFVTSTLLEEQLHLSLNLPDCSRAMQDWLMDKVISQFEEIEGASL